MWIIKKKNTAPHPSMEEKSIGPIQQLPYEVLNLIFFNGKYHHPIINDPFYLLDLGRDWRYIYSLLLNDNMWRYFTHYHFRNEFLAIINDESNTWYPLPQWIVNQKGRARSFPHLPWRRYFHWIHILMKCAMQYSITLVNSLPLSPIYNGHLEYHSECGYFECNWICEWWDGSTLNCSAYRHYQQVLWERFCEEDILTNNGDRGKSMLLLDFIHDLSNIPKDHELFKDLNWKPNLYRTGGYPRKFNNTVNMETELSDGRIVAFDENFNYTYFDKECYMGDNHTPKHEYVLPTMFLDADNERHDKWWMRHELHTHLSKKMALPLQLLFSLWCRHRKGQGGDKGLKKLLEVETCFLPYLIYTTEENEVKKLDIL